MDHKARHSACGIIAVPIAIVVGIIIGILFAFGFIPGIVTATWIAFGIGVLSLIILVTAILVAVSADSCILFTCLMQNICCLLAGIWGTIISALAGLSIVLTPSILVAILVGIGAFFLSLLITSLILFILCIVGKLNMSKIGCKNN